MQAIAAVKEGPDRRPIACPEQRVLTGQALAFEDRGEHRLKGIAEPRRLFALVDS